MLIVLCWILLGIQQMYAQIPGSENGNEQIEIELVETDVPIKKDPITRSLSLKFVQAYLYNKVVSIQFNADPTSVTVEVTRLQTGVKVYSKTIHQDNFFTFELIGCQSDEYKLCIKTDEKMFEGKFAL